MRNILLLSSIVLLSYGISSYAADSTSELLILEQNSYPASGSPQNEVQAAPSYITLPPAPVAAPPAAFVPTGYVEAGGDFHSVTNHFGDWAGEYLKGQVQSDASNSWNGEALNQREFGATGAYGDIGNTHIFNEDWYTSVTAGAGDGGIYLPRYRLDAFLNKKWLDNRQFITTVGLGFDKAVDDHHDASAFLGATYYFQAPWIIQGGIRFNRSDPGNANSTSQFVAVTEGTNKHHFITLRYGFGEEAYQIIGPSTTLSDFHSQQLSLELRQWLSDDWGFNALGERYHNPSYDRTGITLGIFKDF